MLVTVTEAEIAGFFFPEVPCSTASIRVEIQSYLTFREADFCFGGICEIPEGAGTGYLVPGGRYHHGAVCAI